MARVVAVLLLLCATAHAQDQNYWTNQFGTRSHLMGGAVVGGCDDTSAGYYNPARLAWIENSALSVSGTLYQFDRYFVENGAGDDRDLLATNWRVIPTLASGVHMFDFAPGHVFTHMIMARNYTSNSVSAREQRVIDVIARNPGNEDYTGQILFDSSLQEYWGGLGWGWRLTQNFAIGASAVGAFRIERNSVSVNVRATWFDQGQSTFEAASVRSDQYISYWDLRQLFKFGLAFEWEGLKLGATATTVGIHIYGQGTVSRDIEINNVDSNGDNQGETIILNDRQDGLSTDFRSPWSFALGAEYEIAASRTRLAASAEYFLSIGNYTVIEPDSEPFLQGAAGAGGASNEFLRVRDTREGVFNVAAAVTQYFGTWWLGEWTGYWSFYTDFTADVPKRSLELHLGTTDWDLYHGVTGVAVKGERHELALGNHFTFGSDSIESNVDLSDPTEAGLLFGAGKPTRGVFWSIGVIIGYTYFI